MKKNMPRILTLLLTLIALSNYGNAQTIIKADFSGTWVIDLPKSEFGEVPTYTANKQMKVIQTADQLKIERLTLNEANVDSTANEKLSLNGKPVEITGGDHRKRKITANLSADGNSIALRIIVSEPDEPETERFDSNETWTLDNNNGTLVVKKTVKVTDGADYSIKAVYDKK